MIGKEGAYRSSRDAAMRLGSTVIRLADGQPVYITEANSGSHLGYRRITATGIQAAFEGGELKNGDFNIEPVELGNVNYKGQVLYASRMPTRKYKQGLCKSNLRVSGGVLDIQIPTFLVSRFMYKCIMNDYPTIDKILEYDRDVGLGAMAFHRQWHLNFNKAKAGGPFLFYKRTAVGRLEEGVPLLWEDYEYLTESLEGAIQ